MAATAYGAIVNKNECRKRIICSVTNIQIYIILNRTLIIYLRFFPFRPVTQLTTSFRLQGLP